MRGRKRSKPSAEGTMGIFTIMVKKNVPRKHLIYHKERSVHTSLRFIHRQSTMPRVIIEGKCLPSQHHYPWNWGEGLLFPYSRITVITDGASRSSKMGQQLRHGQPRGSWCQCSAWTNHQMVSSVGKLWTQYARSRACHPIKFQTAVDTGTSREWPFPL